MTTLLDREVAEPEDIEPRGSRRSPGDGGLVLHLERVEGLDRLGVCRLAVGVEERLVEELALGGLRRVPSCRCEKMLKLTPSET